jgi:hypothetical protein
MTESWYHFEPHGRTEVTVFVLDGKQARTGARGTRFFKKHVADGANARKVVRDALARMPSVRVDWPQSAWPQPAGLEGYEDEIVLPALMLAAGWSKAAVDRVVQSGREPS